jgi:hypothetical protein
MGIESMKNAVALGAAGSLGVASAVAIATASPSWAVPVRPDAAAVSAPALSHITNVRYHGRRYYYRSGYVLPYWWDCDSYYYPCAYPYSYYPSPYAYPYPFGWGRVIWYY